MHNIIKTQSIISKSLHAKNDAIKNFSDLDESFKAEIIESSDQENDFQIYKQDSSGFVDLCRGPHLPSLKMIGEFKLTHVSGAYWKGDSSKPMLNKNIWDSMEYKKRIK